MEDNVITLNDLKNIIKLFDEFAEKGMFRDFETMEKTITIRNKILTFCQAAENVVKNQQSENISEPSQNKEKNTTARSKKGAKS